MGGVATRLDHAEPGGTIELAGVEMRQAEMLG
jgi:hypothetical protein